MLKKSVQFDNLALFSKLLLYSHVLGVQKNSEILFHHLLWCSLQAYHTHLLVQVLVNHLFLCTIKLESVWRPCNLGYIVRGVVYTWLQDSKSFKTIVQIVPDKKQGS